jgi:hypothetical protein
MFNGRFYNGKQLSLRFVKIDSWKAAICWSFLRRSCVRGRSCNFLHVFRNPTKEFVSADRDFKEPAAPLAGPSTSQRRLEHHNLPQTVTKRLPTKWNEPTTLKRPYSTSVPKELEIIDEASVVESESSSKRSKYDDLKSSESMNKQDDSDPSSDSCSHKKPLKPKKSKKHKRKKDGQSSPKKSKKQKREKRSKKSKKESKKDV